MSPQNEAKLLDILTEIKNTLRPATESHAAIIRIEAILTQHESRITRNETELSAVDDTYVDDLRKQIAKYEGSSQHWVRYVVGVVVSIAIVVFSAALGYLLKK